MPSNAKNNQTVMIEPFFSVILPVYGVEDYITDALEDLKAQSFTDWEVIIIDDCSPDESRAIAEAFAARDSRFRIISHNVNRGLSAARNTGLYAACGEYILSLIHISEPTRP